MLLPHFTVSQPKILRLDRQCVFFPQDEKPSFASIKTTGERTVLYINQKHDQVWRTTR
jgi:hypothetical protein